MKKYIRILSTIVSWITVVITLAACVILLYEYITGSKVPIISDHLHNFIHITLSGTLGFIKINGQNLGDIINGLLSHNTMLAYIIILGSLSVVLIIFAIADSKLINILEVVLGVGILLLLSWMIAIPLIFAGVLKLVTKKTL